MSTANDNVLASFLAQALSAGTKPFLVEGNEPVVAFADLDTLTGEFAARLQALGGAVGDRILVQVEKSAEAVLLYLASLRVGLVFVPLNTAYTSEELDYFIGDAEPAIIVCSSRSLDVIKALARGAAVVSLDEDGSGTLLELQPGEAPPVADRAANDIACILYTSGTTGRSKGAMLTHGNLLSNARTLVEHWQFSERDVLIHILPIFHVHGLFVALHCALLAPATVLFHRGFTPDAVIEDFSRATVLMGVPTHYTRLIGNPRLSRQACAGMRLFVSGSAPLLAADHVAFEEKTGQRILERYGMTETGMITSNPYEGERIAGTVGFPLPGVEVRIRGEQNQTVESGSPGVLEVRGPNVFIGYWRNPQKNAEEFREGGFFVTGDVATQDEEGRVTLVGRAKDLIIAGGLNIYPKEIESAIDEIDGVIESAVIGVPHPDLGEAVVAVVATSGATELDESAIQAEIAPGLARFKQPRRILLVRDLPRNTMGKVQKAALRTTYADLFRE